MAHLLKKILISASVAAGMGLAIGAPASAAGLTGASVSGVDGTDYELYCQVGNTTTANDCTDLNAVLGTDAGNVELDFDSETSGGWTNAVELTGKINKKDITISSLTKSDWTEAVATKWVTDALGATLAQNPVIGAVLQAEGIDVSNPVVLNGLIASLSQELLGSDEVLARLSDPNVSFVEQASVTEEISIGLIGHNNLFDVEAYASFFYEGLADLTNKSSQAIEAGIGQLTGGQGLKLQASELVKVIYNGETTYEYSFKADATGVTETSDGESHSGQYIVKIDGMEMEPPASTPEPSAMVGLAALVGLYAGKRKLQKGTESEA